MSDLPTQDALQLIETDVAIATIDRAIAALDEQRTTIARQAFEITAAEREITRLSADLAAVVAANGLLVARDAKARAVITRIVADWDGEPEDMFAARAFLASTEAGK